GRLPRMSCSFLASILRVGEVKTMELLGAVGLEPTPWRRCARRCCAVRSFCTWTEPGIPVNRDAKVLRSGARPGPDTEAVARQWITTSTTPRHTTGDSIE